MTAAARTAPLLLSAGILLGANGVLLTLIPLRATALGFDAVSIGLMGAAYYLGFLLACWSAPLLVARVGHIRVFAALSALTATLVLLMALLASLPVWLLARALAGFCFSGLLTVIESWLAESAAHGNRARLLSLYRIVDLSAVTGAQFLLPMLGTADFVPFAVAAMLFCVALVPVSLARIDGPPPPDTTRIDPFLLYRVSPLAAYGCITVGLTNSAFRTVGPIYAQAGGLALDQIALFMSAAIVGGALFQYPLGWLADRFPRRNVLLLCTLGAAAGGLLLSLSSSDGAYLGALLFGGFALPLYSLAAAHAGDFAGPGEFVQLTAGVVLYFALGAVVGPTLASFLIDQFGPPAFFAYTTSVHLAFFFLVLYRMSRRPAPSSRKGFVALLRTSPLNLRLFGRR